MNAQYTLISIYFPKNTLYAYPKKICAMPSSLEARGWIESRFYWRPIQLILGILFASFLGTDSTTPSAASAATFSCTIVSEIPLDECQALVALYDSTNGASWTNNNGWLTAYAPCSWHGVWCTAGHVTTISMMNNQLSGTIPSALGSFSKLTNLTLLQNQLIGSIPLNLGDLAHLTTLSLGENQLSGEIPANLGNLLNLSQLWLHSNQLTGSIPDSLMNMPALMILILRDNQLSGPIPKPPNGSQLRALELQQNQLTGPIPPELGHATQLTTLYLNDNDLEGPLPPELGSLPLIFLHLHNNRISFEIPIEWGTLTSSLAEFHLTNNALHGDIPSWVALLSPIGTVGLSYNSLTASDIDVINFLTTANSGWDGTQTVAVENVQVAAISQTTVELMWEPILYTDPADGGFYEIVYSDGIDTVSRFTESDRLTSSYTITGLVAGNTYDIFIHTHTPSHDDQKNYLISDSTQAIQATTASTFECTHVAEIPQTECAALQGLYAETGGTAWANGTGWLENNTPCIWFAVTCNNGHVIQLELGNNHLVGTIPSALGDLTYLQALYLDRNQLTEGIPEELGLLTDLRQLHLSYNQLIGPVPASMINLTALTDLDLAYNGLTPETDAVKIFLNSKQADWIDTQTTAFYDPQGSVHLNGSGVDYHFQMTWIPIPYVADGGYYEFSYATDIAGPYTLVGQTVNKQESAYTISGLLPETDYYIKGYTYTPAHGDQQIEVRSRAAILNFTTPPLPNNVVNGQVWHDNNIDGIRSMSDGGLAGVMVRLTRPDGASVNDITDGDGLYYFGNLPRESYTLTVILPEDWSFTLTDQGSDDGADSDIATILGSMAVVFTAQMTNIVLDVGMYSNATPTPTSTDTATSIVTPTHTSTPTNSAIPTATPTATSTATLTATSIPTVTPTATSTATSTETATLTPTETATITPTNTPVDTATPIPTASYTPTNIVTPTDTQTITSTPTDGPPALTPIPTHTQTETPTPTPTFTVTAIPAAASTEIATPTPMPTFTTLPTVTPTMTPTVTPTVTPTTTSTVTPTETSQPTATSTLTLTFTPTPTETYTPTLTPTVLPTPSPTSSPSPLPVAFDCGHVTNIFGGISKAECDALVAVYNDLGGPNWNDNRGWLENNDPCSWYGVHCDDGVIVSLDLSRNRLHGTLPDELGALASLQNLVLNGNQLIGEIPETLVDLPHLQTINIDYNALWTESEGVIALLDSLGPGWMQTQATPPYSLQAIAQTDTRVLLSWLPILSGDGFYEISYRHFGAGQTDDFIVAGITSGLSVDAYTVAELVPDVNYNFRVRSYTAASDEQPESLWSTYSSLVSTQTLAAPSCTLAPLETNEQCVDLSQQEPEITLAEDGFLTIKLPTIPSTGHFWYPVDENLGEDGAGVPVLRSLGQTFFEMPLLPSPVVGQPAIQIYRLDPIAAGKSSIRLEYRDVQDSVLDTYTVYVNNEGTFDNAQPPSPLVEDQNTLPLYPPGSPGKARGARAANQMPNAFSWCDHSDGSDYCPPVQYQGTCGSSWAFTTVGAMEMLIKIKDGGIDRDLSEQHLISCNNESADPGKQWSCSNGGWYAFDYYTDKQSYPYETGPGTVWELDFLYSGEDLACQAGLTHHETLTSWSYINPDTPFAINYVDEIKEAIYDYGPVVTSLCVGPATQKYSGGLFDTDESVLCSQYDVATNHAVILVGWDDSEGVWIMRNSWDADWGEGGYMRIKYGTSNIGFAAAYALYEGTVLVGPRTPTALTAQPEITDGGYQINLSWTDRSDDENRFHVYRQDGTHWLSVPLSANQTTLTDDQISCNQSYRYRVRAQNDEGNSGYSNIVESSVQCETLQTPINFHVTAGQVGIVLEWENLNTLQDGISILRWNWQKKSWEELNVVAGLGTRYEDIEGLEPGQTYTYVLRAISGERSSLPTEYQSAVAPLLHLGGPTQARAAAVDRGVVSLVWQDNSDNEEGFAVFRYDPASDHWEPIERVDRDHTSYMDTELLCDDQPRYYQVAAYRGDSWSSFSNQASSLPCTALMPTATPTSTPTSTSLPSATPTIVPSPTFLPKVVATPFPILTSTSMPTPTLAQRPTSTPRPTVTWIPTLTPMLRPTQTSTLAPAEMPTEDTADISLGSATPTSTAAPPAPNQEDEELRTTPSALTNVFLPIIVR